MIEKSFIRVFFNLSFLEKIDEAQESFLKFELIFLFFSDSWLI